MENNIGKGCMGCWSQNWALQLVFGLVIFFLGWVYNVTARPIGLYQFTGRDTGREGDDVHRRRRRHSGWQLAEASSASSYGPPFPNQRVQGEREEDEGVPFRRLQAWERGWEEAGHGRP